MGDGDGPGVGVGDDPGVEAQVEEGDCCCGGEGLGHGVGDRRGMGEGAQFGEIVGCFVVE